jgi:hypothetical protein
MKQLDPSNKIPQQIACDESAQNRAAVAADGDDLVEMLDLQAVVKGVTNAMCGMEERERAEDEKVETHERKREEVGGICVLGSFRPAEGSGNSQDEEVDGDQEGSDDTAGAEEEPQERFDAKFGWLDFHLPSQEKPGDDRGNKQPSREIGAGNQKAGDSFPADPNGHGAGGEIEPGDGMKDDEEKADDV